MKFYLWIATVVILVGGSVRWYLKFHPRESWPIAYRYVTVTNHLTVVDYRKEEEDPWAKKIGIRIPTQDTYTTDYYTIPNDSVYTATNVWVTNLYVTNPYAFKTIIVSNIYYTNAYVTNLWITGH